MKDIGDQISATDQSATESEIDETETARSDDDEDEESESESKSERTSIASDENATEPDNDEQSFAEIEKEVEELSTQFQAQENVNSVMFLYDELSVFVVDRFVSHKARTLVQFAEKGILLSGYNWANAPKPVTIRPFVLEILLELALVHSRVEKITKNYKANISESDDAPEASSAIFNEASIAYYDFTTRIFRKLTERLAEVFAEFICNLPHMSLNAAFQTDVEIAFIRNALKAFETKAAKTIFLNVTKFLSEVSEYKPKSSKNNQAKEKILDDMQEMTRLQLGCFQKRADSDTE
jgi:hypothetical protein